MSATPRLSLSALGRRERVSGDYCGVRVPVEGIAQLVRAFVRRCSRRGLSGTREGLSSADAAPERSTISILVEWQGSSRSPRLLLARHDIGTVGIPLTQGAYA